MRKNLLLALVFVLVLSMLTACSTKKETETTTQTPAPAKKRIALLTDNAGTQVFVISMIEGFKASAEKHGFEAIVLESADATAYEDNARAIIEEGVDLLIGGGWQAADSINKMATEFPDKAHYAIIDTEVEAKNVKSIAYREQEGAYLIGMLAALVTEDSDQVFGSVNVNQGAGSWKWRYGYMEGVKAIKPEATFLFNYTGSFNDPAKAKEFAIQQYEQGARFINAAAAGGDKGVFEAALEKGFYTSGQDIDLTTPDNTFVVSSQIKDVHNTVVNLLDEYFSGKAWNYDNEEWGLAEGTIGAVHVTHPSKNPISDKLSEEDIQILKKAAEDIKNGTINLKNMPSEEEYFK